jgi:SAM-dependent methyltransferase
MLQDDIRKHYESNWERADQSAADVEQLRYSSPVEDEVLYPAYRTLVSDLRLIDEETRILDVGSGSGRWVHFLSTHFRPKKLVGVDFAAASVKLLNRWYPSTPHTEMRFDVCDITRPDLDLCEKFDLINIANVLFHIPEADRYARAIQNLSNHLAPGGRIVTTEYLPRTTMRTEWMLVRSRYEFEAIIHQAGLKIIDTRAFCFFSNDPMGLDGPDTHTRGHFNRVRSMTQQLLTSATDPGTRKYLIQMLAEIERACVSFSRERVADVDLPSQKLVVLGAR